MLTWGYKSLEQACPDDSIFVDVDGTQAALVPVDYDRWNGQHAKVSLGMAFRWYRLWQNGEVREIGHTGLRRVPSREMAERVRRVGRAAGYLSAPQREPA